MTKITSARAFTVLFAALSLNLGAQQQTPQIQTTHPMPDVVEVRVDPHPTAEVVPPELFGGFIEPIGHSINNGIMAQILINPSLESGLFSHGNEERLYASEPALDNLGPVRGLPLPWLPWSAAAGNRFELRVGDAANSYQSLALYGTPDGETGILQHVYLPVHRTRQYIATVYARALNGSTGVLTLGLQNGEGKVVVRAGVDITTDKWKEFSVPLAVPAGAIAPRERAAFGLYVSGESRIEVDQITLTPADAVNGFDPDVLQLAKAMNMTELRFGGNYSSFYHWQDGLGDPDRRRTLVNIGWGIPEYNNFGTDEFLDLCRRLNVVPQVDLNMGTGTPEEAADWVRYIRQRYKDPVIWELGNELWGSWQVAPPTLAQLPSRTEAFSNAVRAVSPNDTIIATGSNTTQYQEWTTAELTLQKGTFELLSLHFVQTSGQDTVWKPRDPASTLMVYAKSYHVGQVFPPMQAEVEASAQRNGVHFAMTEWLFHSMGRQEGDFRNDFPSWMNLGGAVAAGGFFNTLFRHTAEVRLADMTGTIDFAGIAKERERVYAQPAFYVFQMYSSVKGQQIVPVRTNSGTYQITDPRYLFPRGGDIPFVDAVATLTGDRHTLSLFLVNRALQDAAIHVGVPGWQLSHSEVLQIAGSGTFAQNTEEHPQAIIPQQTEQDLNGPLTLPAQSVTRIVLVH